MGYRLLYRPRTMIIVDLYKALILFVDVFFHNGIDIVEGHTAQLVHHSFVHLLSTHPSRLVSKSTAEASAKPLALAFAGSQVIAVVMLSHLRHRLRGTLRKILRMALRRARVYNYIVIFIYGLPPLLSTLKQ